MTRTRLRIDLDAPETVITVLLDLIREELAAGGHPDTAARVALATVAAR